MFSLGNFVGLFCAGENLSSQRQTSSLPHAIFNPSLLTLSQSVRKIKTTLAFSGYGVVKKSILLVNFEAFASIKLVHAIAISQPDKGGTTTLCALFAQLGFEAVLCSSMKLPIRFLKLYVALAKFL